MFTILPFEIISRKDKSLLISYLSAVDLSHQGMKNILEALHQIKGTIADEELSSLLLKQDIPCDEGEAFLISSGVIKQAVTSKNRMWENAVIITDNTGLFDPAPSEWQTDGISITGIYDIESVPADVQESTLLWLHLEVYSPGVIRDVYRRYHSVTNVAFIQSYYLKEIFRIDGVYSPLLGTPCHFCHIERWINREEKSFRRDEMSWANLLKLLQVNNSGLPAIALSNTERGFSTHLIKRRFQELIGNPLIKLHADTLMASVSTDLITCVLNREPVIHWHACDCTGR